jgi:hypothetical protein
MTQITADVLFCDDIRQEVTGKFIFIGVYSGDLIPQSIPSNFGLAMFLRVHGLSNGKHSFHVVVTYPDGSIFLEQKDEIETGAPGTPMALIFGGMQTQIKEPGNLEAKIKIAGREILAGRLRILPPAPPQNA